MAEECSRTALASAIRCWCNGKAAFCCVEQKDSQDVAVHVGAQLALARITLSGLAKWRVAQCHVVGQQLAELHYLKLEEQCAAM